jgi:hypothetical protein
MGLPACPRQRPGHRWNRQGLRRSARDRAAARSRRARRRARPRAQAGRDPRARLFRHGRGSVRRRQHRRRRRLRISATPPITVRSATSADSLLPQIEIRGEPSRSRVAASGRRSASQFASRTTSPRSAPETPSGIAPVRRSCRRHRGRGDRFETERVVPLHVKRAASVEKRKPAGIDASRRRVGRSIVPRQRASTGRARTASVSLVAGSAASNAARSMPLDRGHVATALRQAGATERARAESSRARRAARVERQRPALAMATSASRPRVPRRFRSCPATGTARRRRSSRCR